MVDISSSSGARITAHRRRHDHIRRRVLSAPRHAQQRRDGTASPPRLATSRRVKGIIGIHANMVLNNTDLLGRALTVLIAQWGLDVVEVRISRDMPEAAGLVSRTSPHILTVAGHSFPFVLERE